MDIREGSGGWRGEEWAVSAPAAQPHGAKPSDSQPGDPRDERSAPPTASLARVTYLPGVLPSDAKESAGADSAGADARGADAHGADSEGDASARSGGRTPSFEADDSHDDEPQEPAVTTAADRRAQRAANVSMNALTRRGQSRWELEKILTARELDPEEIAEELARLESVGLIDDAALAETLVRTQHERKGLGRSALVAELRRRHIDQEQIDTALEQLDDDSEITRARELAERRAPQLRSLDHTTAVRRLTGYLMRKGYPSGVIRAVVDDALSEGKGTVRFR